MANSKMSKISYDYKPFFNWSEGYDFAWPFRYAMILIALVKDAYLKWPEFFEMRTPQVL